MQTIVSKKALLAVVLVLGAVALTGCIKVKQNTMIMPDGSGSMSFRIGFNATAIQETVGGMMGGGGESGGGMEMDDPTSVDISDLMKDFEGFVAFSVPKPEIGSDGWNYVSFTGYFEDINQVRVYDGEGDERYLKTSFSFKKTETGYVLEGQNMFFEDDEEGMGDMGDMAESPEMEEMVKGMLKVLMKGFEVSMSVQMPGAVSTAEGLPTTEGRVAKLVMTADQMANIADMKKLSETKNFKVVCNESQVSADEMKSFRMELDKAKAEWADLKAKAAAEDDDDGHDDDEDDGHGDHEHDGHDDDGK